MGQEGIYVGIDVAKAKVLLPPISSACCCCGGWITSPTTAAMVGSPVVDATVAARPCALVMSSSLMVRETSNTAWT